MSSFEIQNPATGEVITRLEADTAQSIDDKIARARAAQKSWKRVPLAERLAALAAFKDRIEKDRDRLAAITTAEVGKPIQQSKNELNGLLGRLAFFLEHTAATLATEEVFTDASMTERIAHEPLGTIANVSAWNYPYFVGSNVFVPALLAGNAVLYKPSEHASMTGVAIAEALHASGIPKDVFATVLGLGDVGAELVKRKLDGVFFTGSYATGKKIAAAAGQNMSLVQLELGGKDPVYVAGDVDVASAAAATADGAFYNAGQSCCAVERIYVHASIHDAFVRAFVEEVGKFVIGDPTDPATYLGPLTRAPQIAVIEAQIAEAIAKGAKLETGGKRLDRKGNYFAPTVLTNVNGSMALMREESFGPVIGIEAVQGDEDAIAKMNDTDYGLTAGVYTKDRARAERVLAEVDAGSAYWNCCDRVSPRLPWSGRNHSGLGLTLSKYGILAFTRPKAWHMRAG